MHWTIYAFNTKHEIIAEKYRCFIFPVLNYTKTSKHTFDLFLVSHKVHSNEHKICEFCENVWSRSLSMELRRDFYPYIYLLST